MSESSKHEEEILQFMNPEAAGHLKLFAVDYFLGLTGSKEGSLFITSNKQYLSAIVDLTGDCNDPIIEKSYLTLVNLTGVEAVCDKLLTLEKHPDIVFNLLTYVLQKESLFADIVCSLLSNMSRSPKCAEEMVKVIIERKDEVGFDKIIHAFCHENFNPKNKLHFIGPVLSNLTQIREARKYILDHDKCVVQRLLPFTNFEESKVRRHGIIGALKNCCFETDHHEWLLSDSVDILPRLLLPLTGPEEFDDEEMEKLPVDLQYMEPDKQRESDPEIRKMLVEAIMQLCALKVCRAKVKESGAYYIIRELHKWEENEDTKEAIQNLVHVLIMDEPEPGMENLNEVEVPENIQKQFENVDQEKQKEL